MQAYCKRSEMARWIDFQAQEFAKQLSKSSASGPACSISIWPPLCLETTPQTSLPPGRQTDREPCLRRCLRSSCAFAALRKICLPLYFHYDSPFIHGAFFFFSLIHSPTNGLVRGLLSIGLSITLNYLLASDFHYSTSSSMNPTTSSNDYPYPL